MKLQDTAELMNSSDYKERFQAEYYQLVIRIKKLQKFLTDSPLDTLTQAIRVPSELFGTQLKAMLEYQRVLEIRASLDGIILEEIEIE